MTHQLSYQQYQAFGHLDRVFDVAFHPGTSSVVASGAEDSTVRVWRQEPGNPQLKQIVCCYGHEAEVLRLGWSLDGHLLASGSADNTVRVWDIPLEGEPSSTYNGHQVALLSGHPEEVYHCDFVTPGTPHPARQTLATASANGRMELPDVGPGSHLLTASGESLFLWDLEGGVLTQKADAPGTSGSSVPADAVVTGYKHAYIFACCQQPTQPRKGSQQGGQLIACACSDGVLRLWVLLQAGLQYIGSRDLTSGGGPGTLTAMTWNDAGTLLAVVVKDGRVMVLDTRQQLRVCHTIKLPCTALTATTLPGTSSLLTGGVQGEPQQEMLLLGCSDGRLRIIPWPDGTTPITHSHAWPITDMGPHSPGTEYSMLALSVSANGNALAMSGTPTTQLLQPSSKKQAAGLNGQATKARSLTGSGPDADMDVVGAAGAGGGLAAVVAVTAARRRRRDTAGAAGRGAGAAPVSVLQALDKAVQSLQLEGHGDGMDSSNGLQGTNSSAGAGLSGIEGGTDRGLSLDAVTNGSGGGAGHESGGHHGHAAPPDPQVRAPVYVWHGSAG